MSNGYVYILINNSMEGLIKIGRTTRSSDVRAKELSSTSVPTPFQVAYEVFSEESKKLEKLIHQKLDEFRINSNREFFKYPLSKAIKLIQELNDQPKESDSIFSAISIFDALKGKYKGLISENIFEIRIVQVVDIVWLEVSRYEAIKGGYLLDQIIRRMDLAFITDFEDFDNYSDVNLYFSPESSVEENASKFVNEFGSYSIAETTDIFTKEACKQIINASK